MIHTHKGHIYRYIGSVVVVARQFFFDLIKYTLLLVSWLSWVMGCSCRWVVTCTWNTGCSCLWIIIMLFVASSYTWNLLLYLILHSLLFLPPPTLSIILRLLLLFNQNQIQIRKIYIYYTICVSCMQYLINKGI